MNESVSSKTDLAPCPFCGRPDQVRLQQQELYGRDERGIAILTPAGFAALDRYHEMTDKIEELIAENDRLKRATAETKAKHPDTVRLDWIEGEYADVRAREIRYHDDADVVFDIVTHWQAKPNERTVGSDSSLRLAIDIAMRGEDSPEKESEAKAECSLCAAGMNSFIDPDTGKKMHARNGAVMLCSAQKTSAPKEIER